MKNLILVSFLLISCQTISSLGETYNVLTSHVDSTYRIIYTMNGYGSRLAAREKVLSKAYDVCSGKFKLDSLYFQTKSSAKRIDVKPLLTHYIAIADVTCIVKKEKTP